MAARYLLLLASLSFALMVCTADDDFESFKGKFSKSYESQEEEANRKIIYSNNVQAIKAHNERFYKGQESFSMAVNHLSDLTNDEIKARNGHKKTIARRRLRMSWGTTSGYGTTGSSGDGTTGSSGYGTTASSGGDSSGGNGAFSSSCYSAASNGYCCSWSPSSSGVPSSKDWRDAGIVTSIKNQGQCGSCWTFASTGAIESAWAKKSGVNYTLSEQQIVDCDSESNVNGCHGGNAEAAFTYIKAAGGQDSGSSYPYQGVKGSCKFSKSNVQATVSGCANVVPSGSEDALKNAIAAVGAVAVAIDASHPSFQSYSSGVYHDAACSSSALDHAVLAVGYGHDQSLGMDYWLIKNSWGTGWGEDGFIRIERNNGNMCGVATSPSLPLI